LKNEYATESVRYESQLALVHQELTQAQEAVTTLKEEINIKTAEKSATDIEDKTRREFEEKLKETIEQLHQETNASANLRSTLESTKQKYDQLLQQEKEKFAKEIFTLNQRLSAYKQQEEHDEDHRTDLPIVKEEDDRFSVRQAAVFDALSQCIDQLETQIATKGQDLDTSILSELMPEESSNKPKPRKNKNNRHKNEKEKRKRKRSRSRSRG